MIAIIKYDGGNTASVQNALNKLGCDSIITNNIDVIQNADRVILPGVGEAGTAMQSLKNYGLDAILPNLTQPLLGICLGMQLLCSSTEEGNTDCLGIFDIPVRKFPEEDIVPHIGWNNIEFSKNRLFSGLAENDVYFVHSYYAPMSANTIATCNYILPFSAALQKNNFYGAQFHPEKSADTGELILKNFLSL